MKKTITGFTIVELLIVIVVIAILATISIVAYRGIQNRAYDTSVEADIAIITRKLELAKVDLGHYPQNGAEFPDFKFNKSVYDTTQNNIYYCVDKTNDKYAVGVRSKSMKAYILNTGTISISVSGVGGAITCDAIGKTPTGDATTYYVPGYTAAPTSAWTSSWSWTN